MILGIDEVGRGPWAGPLVVGAVVLGDARIDGLTDSKKLSAKRRAALASQIYEQAAAVGLGWVSARELDEIGLSAALRLATKRAVSQIHTPYHEIIIDGTVNFLADTNKAAYVQTLTKADLLIGAVSAASIVAKEARDAYMRDLDEVYPGYHFGAHVGYGTKAHRDALDAHGPTLEHRHSFSPIAVRVPSTTDVEHETAGSRAETVAATYIESLGHTLLARNWKTKYCEIDIVSQHAGIIYVHEVKYRRDGRWGDGLSALTAKKRHQVMKAARMYVQFMGLHDQDIRLMAVALSGEPPQVQDYLEFSE